MRLNTSLILMSTTIHLDGKKQAIVDNNGQPEILQKIIEKLYDRQQKDDLRKNLKVAFTNISELPEGFLKITNELSEKVELLDEVFGVHAIKGLHQLMPALRDYNDPLRINPFQISNSYSKYVRAMGYLMKKYGVECA